MSNIRAFERSLLIMGSVTILVCASLSAAFAKQESTTPKPVHEPPPPNSTQVDNSLDLGKLKGGLMLKDADQINLLNALATMDISFWPGTLKKNHGLLNEDFIRVLSNRGFDAFNRAIQSKKSGRDKEADGYVEISFRYMLLADLCASEVNGDGGFRLDLAKRFADTKNYAMAMAILGNILVTEPEHVGARFLCGNIREKTGDFYGAMVDYQHVVEKEPNNDVAWTGIGKAYLITSDFPKARDAFKHAIACNSRNSEASTLLDRLDHPMQIPPPGQMQPVQPAVTGGNGAAEAIAVEAESILRQNKVKEAEAEFKRALQLEMTNARAHMGLADIAFRQSRFLDAINEYSLASQYAPTNPEPLRYLALSCEKVYDETKSPAYLDRAIECVARAITIASATRSDYAAARADQERLLAKKAEVPVSR